MSQFQRMIVIPQEEYLQLSSMQNVRQPLTQHFHNLESQYNQEAQVKDPYKRLVLQSGTLEEMKQLKEQMRHYISVSTPKPYRSRAQALLENVSTFLRFNERGEIYDKQNNVIENSRLEDLIQHAVRERRRNISPVGWNYFRELLREHNTPKSILNRNTIEEMGRNENSMQMKVKEEANDSGLKKQVQGVKFSKIPVRERPVRSKQPSQKYLDFLKSY